MAKPIKFDESGDNEDLQALFDSIAAGGDAAKTVSDNESQVLDTSGDSPELQALFDSIVAQVGEAAPTASAERSASSGGSPEVFNRLGKMTRELHDALRELGYDKVLEETARAIPDARQRLSYIVQMTEQAASRVLNATEIAKPIQDALHGQSKALGSRWEKVFANQLSPAEFKALAADTHTFLRAMPKQINTTNEQLLEIMMAQDFQDLTGQVIKKVIDLAQGMETELLKVLVEAMPAEVRAETPEGLLNGPVINTMGRSDVVTSQTQVDDLLESLGF
jgi:chemotaxis protein CheZ